MKGIHSNNFIAVVTIHSCIFLLNTSIQIINIENKSHDNPTTNKTIIVLDSVVPLVNNSLNICIPNGTNIIVRTKLFICHNIVVVRNVEDKADFWNPFLLKYQYPIASPPIDKGVIKEIIAPIIELIIKCLILTLCP